MNNFLPTNFRELTLMDSEVSIRVYSRVFVGRIIERRIVFMESRGKAG